MKKPVKSLTLAGGHDYEKVHRLKKVADIHEKKLKARGAKVKRSKLKSGYKLTYTF